MPLLKIAFIQFCLGVIPPAYFEGYFKKESYLDTHLFISSLIHSVTTYGAPSVWEAGFYVGRISWKGHSQRIPWSRGVYILAGRVRK